MNEPIDFAYLREPDTQTREDRVIAAVMAHAAGRAPAPFDIVAAVLDLTPIAAVAVALAIGMSMLPGRSVTPPEVASVSQAVGVPASAERLIRQEGAIPIQDFVLALGER